MLITALYDWSPDGKLKYNEFYKPIIIHGVGKKFCLKNEIVHSGVFPTYPFTVSRMLKVTSITTFFVCVNTIDEQQNLQEDHPTRQTYLKNIVCAEAICH